MIIDFVADLHGYYPETRGGDILIVAGDCTANDVVPQWVAFFNWFSNQKYRKKILVAGNHDSFLEKCVSSEERKLMGIEDGSEWCDYLVDSGCEFEGLKIWGTPRSLWFMGMNTFCANFCSYESTLEEYFSQIPEDTDILISHSPPYGILDEAKDKKFPNKQRNAGSRALLNCMSSTNVKLNIFGHIHEKGGKHTILKTLKGDCLCVNCSFVDEHYQPMHGVQRVVLDEDGYKLITPFKSKFTICHGKHK